MKRFAAVAGVSLVFALTACSGTEAPPVETIQPKPSATPTASASESPAAAEPGTRGNPLAIGEQRKLSSDSMWSIGAEGASQVGAGYIVLPLHLGVDWEAGKAQGLADGEGVDPWNSLTIEYVTAGGRSYNSADTYVEVANQFFEVGTIYEPLAEVSANYVVTLPDADIAGGAWKISNSQGSSVFLAAQ